MDFIDGSLKRTGRANLVTVREENHLISKRQSTGERKARAFLWRANEMSETLNSLQAKARTEVREAGLNLLESKMAEMVVTKFL